MKESNKNIKKIESVTLYSEPSSMSDEVKNYYLKIVLGFETEEEKGRIIIPKVVLPIGYCPSSWDLETMHEDSPYAICSHATLYTDMGRFEVLPGKDGMIINTEFDHRVMTKEEIEKELGYKIEIKGVCECPCKKKGDDNA